MMDIDGKPCSPRISEVFITIIIFLLAEGGLGACSFKSYSDKLYYQLLMLGVDHCYTKRSAREINSATCTSKQIPKNCTSHAAVLELGFTLIHCVVAADESH